MTPSFLRHSPRPAGEARPAPASARRALTAPVIITSALLGLFLAEIILSAWTPATRDAVAFDYETYMAAARRWLAGGGFYHDYQLTGSYTVWNQEILYPPTALILFVPFVFLPPIAWWAIPLGILAVVLAWHRPAAWGWAVIMALLILPVPFEVAGSWSIGLVVLGNPGLWVVAAVAAATRLGWTGVFVLLKPSLLPFAFIGVRRRSWWIALVLLVAVSLILWPLWEQYLTVLADASSPRMGLLYSLSDIPAMLVPLVAWMSGRHRPDAVERLRSVTLGRSPHS